MALAKPLGPALSRPLASDFSSKVAQHRCRWRYTILCELIDILYKVLFLLRVQELLFLVLHFGWTSDSIKAATQSATVHPIQFRDRSNILRILELQILERDFNCVHIG